VFNAQVVFVSTPNSCRSTPYTAFWPSPADSLQRLAKIKLMDPNIRTEFSYIGLRLIAGNENTFGPLVKKA
jgi:hypothetical protein